MTKSERNANFGDNAGGMRKFQGPRGYVTIQPNWDGSCWIVLITKGDQEAIRAEIKNDEVDKYCQQLVDEGHRAV